MPRMDNEFSVALEPMREHEHALRFRIDARLRVEPAPDPVTFYTVLQLHSGKKFFPGCQKLKRKSVPLQQTMKNRWITILLGGAGHFHGNVQ